MLKDLAKSVLVVLKLHNDYKGMIKDVLFNVINDIVEEMEVDARSKAILLVLLYSTRKERDSL